MTSRLLRPLAALALATQLVSCAAGTLVPDESSMPAARAALRPEFRIFYDSLEDYGDWVLIEPYGYVFRPRVNFVAWRPYEQGFWAPTDVYGWVWVSSEPFGWATYHYGSWLYDDYQGYVWVPGADWGPSWVDWAESDQYVGWSPMLARGSDPVPGGSWTFVPYQQLVSPSLGTIVATQRQQIQSAVKATRPVQNPTTVEGVRIERGPPIERVERFTGPLRRVAIDDLVAPGDAAAARAGVGTRAPVQDGARPLPTSEATQSAAEAAARQAKSISTRGVVGPSVPVVRPFGVDRSRSPAGRIAPRGKAAADTTR